MGNAKCYKPHDEREIKAQHIASRKINKDNLYVVKTNNRNNNNNIQKRRKKKTLNRPRQKNVESVVCVVRVSRARERDSSGEKKTTKKKNK